MSEHQTSPPGHTNAVLTEASKWMSISRNGYLSGNGGTRRGLAGRVGSSRGKRTRGFGGQKRRGRGRTRTNKTAFVNASEVEAFISKTSLMWLEKCTEGWKYDSGFDASFTMEDNFVEDMLDNRAIYYFNAVKENLSV